MKKLFKSFLLLPALIFVGVAFENQLSAATAFVYDTGSELLTSADFNNDGVSDVLVVDKLTGNLRVGLLDAGGNFSWSAPLVGGVENATACAIGQFLTNGQNSVAITGPDFNRVNLVSVANTNSATNAVIWPLFGVGPNLLITLENPLGAVVSFPTNLLVGTSQNAGNAETLERMQVFSGFSITPFTPAQFNEPALFERGNALALNPSNSPSFAAGLVRAADADRFDILQFTNAPGGVLLSLTNLPPGGDYACGNFNSETLPRFAFYQVGTSNVIFAPLLAGTNGLAFGTNVSFPLAEAVKNIFYLPSDAGTFLVEFSDGIQAVNFSGDIPVAGNVYRSGLADTNNVFSGLVPLANGQFVLLDSAAEASPSTHAQVVKFDGTNFTQISSSTMPAIATRSTRANVWLFQTEPFVNPDPGFVASFASPDWSDLIGGLPGAFSIVDETDAGTATGLGNVSTNSPGTPPTGANFGLANQVADGISIFSYASPRAAEPITITISPPAGFYSGPIQIAFSALAPGGLIYYRVGAANAWQLYASPFSLTNNAAVEYYGVSSSGAPSRLLTANYSFANSTAPATTLNLTNGLAVTGSPPPTGNGGNVVLSAGGTIFYGRKNSSGGAIWAINLDGSGDTYLTTGARPRVSHDGRYLAFMRGTNVFGPGGGDIWLRDLSTGVEQKFFTNNLQIVGYDWDSASPPNLILDYGCSFWKAPLSNSAAIFPLTNSCNFAAPVINQANGSLAFFDASTGGGIRTVAASGGISTLLGATSYGSRWPAWSPDGTHLAFCFLNNFSASNGLADLYTINVNGSGVAQISAFTNVNDGFLYGALWTPAGDGLIGAGSIYGTNGLWLIPLTSDGQHCDCPARLLPTTAGDPIDFAGSVISAPAAVIAKPGLFIRSDANAIVVYWSTNYQGFILQATASLNPDSSWDPISGPYFLNGSYYEYHEAKTSLAATKIFRLAYPGTIVIQPSQPKLSMQLQSGQAVLAWSTNYVGYTLEGTTNLTPPVIWSPLNATGVNPSGQFEFRQNPALPRQFFRLHWQ
jgi:hypothetical protein